MARYWLVLFPRVRSEVRRWKHRANAIPSSELRADALETLAGERLNVDGAALFATIPRRCHRQLVPLLVAWQALADFLDTITERPVPNQVANGLQLYRALADALDPAAPRCDYYRYDARGDDGGYLAALVETCRAAFAALPAYAQVQPVAVHAARCNRLQSIVHDPNARRRAEALERWVVSEIPHLCGLTWFEHGAAAVSSLHVLALLAIASDPATTPTDVAAVSAVYFPWVCALNMLLDSLVDRDEDATSGDHSFIAQYGSADDAIISLAVLAGRSMNGARELRDGGRHAVIVAGMVAMYLSKASAWTPAAQPLTEAVIAASGNPVGPLLLVLRLRRLARAGGDGALAPRALEHPEHDIRIEVADLDDALERDPPVVGRSHPAPKLRARLAQRREGLRIAAEVRTAIQLDHATHPSVEGEREVEQSAL
jgi:tetraprenyl-beta-curcumene synthase